jgi:hypothetical protein
MADLVGRTASMADLVGPRASMADLVGPTASMADWLVLQPLWLIGWSYSLYG